MNKIGTTCYIVAKAWKNKEHLGAKALPAKIVGYQNLHGKLLPILRSSGKEQSAETNHVFYSLEEAINQLKCVK